MICAELEHLEAELDDLITALENPRLGEAERAALEIAYERLSQRITRHQDGGHAGSPCYEE